MSHQDEPSSPRCSLDNLIQQWCSTYIFMVQDLICPYIYRAAALGDDLDFSSALDYYYCRQQQRSSCLVEKAMAK